MPGPPASPPGRAGALSQVALATGGVEGREVRGNAESARAEREGTDSDSTAPPPDRRGAARTPGTELTPSSRAHRRSSRTAPSPEDTSRRGRDARLARGRRNRKGRGVPDGNAAGQRRGKRAPKTREFRELFFWVNTATW